MYVYDFTFVEGLTGLQEEMRGEMQGKRYTLTVIKHLRDTLKDFYCFDTEYIEEDWFITVVVPVGYSDIKVGWILEIYKYYLPAPIGVKVVRDE